MFNASGTVGGNITKTDDAELIASLEYYIEGDASSWTELVIPFTYKSSATPEKFNIIIAAEDYFADRSVIGNGNQITVDDVELLYYSELSSAKYDGSEVVFTNGAATIDASYDASKLTDLTSNGHGATIETSYNEESGVLTITVKGEDISENASNFHTYTIQFKQKVYECDLLTLTYDGVALPFSADDATEAFIDGPFDESKLAYTVSEDATVDVSFNEEDHILYVDVTAGDGKTANSYEIQFYYKGDVNKDGTVSIADVTALVNMILGKTEKNEMADVNADGDVSIADVTALVNIILGKN